MDKMRANDIVVRTSKPEKILVYLLYYMQFWSSEKTIWMEIWDAQKNTLEQINVSKIYASMESVMVKALPAWYIFTGCEYEPSFFAKGKKTASKKFEKNTEYQLAFANFELHEH